MKECNQPIRWLLLCGLHRSGTSFLVSALKRGTRLPVADEPLNEERGVASVPVAYPYVGATGGAYASLLDEIANFARPWGHGPVPQYRSFRFARSLLYRATGGRSGLRWRYLRLAAALGHPPSSIIWKDPFASLATPYLLKSHVARAVCLIRHPAAVHLSTSLQGWSFDVENLRRQLELLRDYADDIRPAEWELARRNPAGSIALLWKLMVRINLELSERERGLLIIRHEDLCIHPEESLRKVATHLGLGLSEAGIKFILTRTRGTKVMGSRGRVYDFHRNSQALVDAWRTRIATEDETVIRQLVAADLYKIYEHW